ncbi:MAG: A24 family peptidase [Myxococcales bacterium]|nr:A24 family peptidase [Myxococcota bacterium]MDW8283134.1 A24 family peptidase [Myxococcales bacterium]
MPRQALAFSLLEAPGAPVALALLFGSLAVATVTDLRRRRIPNVLTLPAAAAGLVLHAISGGGWTFLSSLLALGLWFAGGLTFWSLSRGQGIGAGDVKMVMAAAALVGFWPTFWMVFASNLLQVLYLFIRWIVQGTSGENVRRLGTWVVSIVAPGTKVVPFRPAGMEDKTPHAPFLLAGAAAMVLLARKGVLPW